MVGLHVYLVGNRPTPLGTPYILEPENLHNFMGEAKNKGLESQCGMTACTQFENTPFEEKEKSCFK